MAQPAGPSEQPISVRQQEGASLDRQQAQRLERIMLPLIQHMDRPAVLREVRIGVSKDADINAAYAGDGTFLITTGLLSRANDEHLRAIMAHEIAHADLGHMAKTRALGTGVQIGTIILDQILPGSGTIAPFIADLGIMKPFSRGEEYEADLHAAEILTRSGYNGNKVMADTLAWLMKTSGPSGGFFTTHPGTADRIQRLASGTR
jgi:Zn-dependent protease with chaperone function